MALVADFLAQIVVQFGREGAATHTRAVGLENAQNFANAVWRQAQAGACSRGGSRGRGHKGVGAKVNIQQGALGAFGEDFLARLVGLLDQDIRIRQVHAAQALYGLHPMCFSLCEVKGRLKVSQEFQVLLLQSFVARQIVRQFNVTNTKTVAARFVHVGRSDALEGGANLVLSFGGLRSGIQQTVRRKNQVGFARDDQALEAFGLHGQQLVDFLAENDRIHDHTVANNVQGIFVKNARRNRVQNVLDAIKLQGVTGIWAALKAGYHVVATGQYVHNFPFSFVPPLEAKQDVCSLAHAFFDFA